MTSLAELRMIEEQRIVGERNARVAEEAARIAAREAAEQAIRDAEASRAAQERAAALAYEKARADAEREARLRVEMAEAAERQRQQAALEERRMTQEVQLRREAVARTRPTWMVVLTSLAVIAGLGLAVFAFINIRAAREAKEEARLALIEQEKMKAERLVQAESLKVLDKQSSEMDKNLTTAIKAVERAQTLADLKARNAELGRIAEAKRQLDLKRANDKAALERKIRLDGIKLDPKCVKDPVGCLDTR